MEKIKKFLYLIFVILYSCEFVSIFAFGFIFIFYKQYLNFVVLKVNFNADLIKYLILLPISIFIWILKEVKDVVVLEKDNIKFLVNWPNYWKFKIHLLVSIIYGFIFIVFSTIPWVRKENISDALGLALFFEGLLGMIIVASSIYFAQISLKEIFNKD